MKQPYYQHITAGEFRSLWPEHWTNGGTGMTKFDPEKLPLFEKAIAEYGDPAVFIENNALHSTRRDLSAFWEVFRRIEAEAANADELNG
jgi:hypothetical protein